MHMINPTPGTTQNPMANRLRKIGSGKFALVALLAALITSTQQLHASEYRKCLVKLYVQGEGLTQTEVEGVRYTTWGRALLASHAWSRVNVRASACARNLVKANYNELPKHCEANKYDLDGGNYGAGVTGLATTRVKSRIKKTVCENHRRAKDDKVRTVKDTRKIDGFLIGIRPVGNSQACKNQTVMKPRYQTIHCRSDGRDTEYEWHYKK